MHERPHDDLLSAYHDGELSAAEREVASRRAEESPAARAELAAYSGLSALLHELPPATLPPEFSSQVLQQLERRTLLTERPAAAPPGPGSRRLAWRWVLVPLSAAAAVALVLWLPRGEAPVLTADNSLPAAPEAGFAPGLGGGLGTTREAELQLAGDAPVAVAAAAPMVETESLKVTRGARLSDEAAVSEQVNTVLYNSVRQNTAVAMNGVAGYTQEQLRNAQPGQMLEVFGEDDGEVKVVRVWVVDRQQGLNELRLLLRNQEIEPLPTEDDAEYDGLLAEKAASAAPAKPGEIAAKKSGADELVAVFVEASDDQLNSALQGLGDMKALVSLDVQPPVELAAIQNRKQFGDAVPANRRAETDKFGNRPMVQIAPAPPPAAGAAGGKPGAAAPLIADAEARRDTQGGTVRRGAKAEAKVPAAAPPPAPLQKRNADAGRLASAADSEGGTAERAKDFRSKSREQAVQTIVTVEPEVAQLYFNGAKKQDALQDNKAELAEKTLKGQANADRALRQQNQRKATDGQAKPRLQVIFLVQQVPKS